MSKTLLKTCNKIITYLLALSGFACTSSWLDTKVAYGTPQAEFIVKGKVVSANNNTTIRGIRVIAKYTNVYTASRQDTLTTDLTGNYTTKSRNLPADTNVNLSFTDIDGIANGSFQPLDTMVTFTNPKFTGGDGNWYEGTTEKIVNIKMKSK
jgi:putative lipoprotein (rSAM/lipoprotein system)